MEIALNMAKNIVSKLERLDDIFQRYNAKCDECYKSGDPMSVKGLAEFVQYGFIDAQGIIRMASEIRAKSGSGDRTKVIPAAADSCDETSHEKRRFDRDVQGLMAYKGRDYRLITMLLHAFDGRYAGSKFYDSAKREELIKALGLTEERK